MPYQPGNVSKLTRILFPIIVTFIAGIVAPMSVALVGFLMFGNLLRECGVLGRLSDTAQNVLSNLVTLLLGITISFSMRADMFVSWQTILIMALGLVAFVFDSIGGVLFAKLLNLFRKNKVNPMIGAAVFSAFPMIGACCTETRIEGRPDEPFVDASNWRKCFWSVASVLAGGMILYLIPQLIR